MFLVPRERWASLAPTRWSWVRLVATPSSYLLLIALVATMIAKAHVMRGLEEVEFWPGRWLAAIAADGVVFVGLAGLFALAEHATRRAIFFTLPFSIVIAILGVVSAIQLWITGEQLSSQVLVLGLERFTDVRAMARASLDVGLIRGVVLLVAIAGPPAAAMYVLRGSGKTLHPAAGGGERARAAGPTVACALVLVLLAPMPDQLASLYRNAVVHTLWGLATNDQSWNGGLGLFTRYEPHDLVDDAALAKLSAAQKPNVVVIILESTRRDETTLSGPQARAKTPNLVALAARGVEVTHGRAVIPQTTKSMWSMFCGRLPILQPKLYETTSVVDVQCVPHILDAAGWRTGFLQSAIGRFEDRPRLARRLGFREFLAAEQFTDTVSGYLSTDDEALVGQLDTWLGAKQDRPFFVTLLTSSTHHPYMLTDGAAARAKQSGAPIETDRDRYDRQIEAADTMVGEIVELLRHRGLYDHTIVVVLGDHGEGFGDKPPRQHALDYYEEGLRVPWVIAGPGVPVRRVDANASLLDLAPTLLDLLGVSLSPEALAATHARSVLSIAGDRVLPFSCFFDKSCFGYVVGNTKVVAMREIDLAFAFDLATDPDERSPQALSPELRKTLADVQRSVDLHRTNSKPRMRDEMLEFWPWNCPRDEPCGIKPQSR